MQIRKKLSRATATLVLMLLVTIVGTGCTDSNDKPVTPQPSELTDAEKAELLERAYVYTLPLMLMDATYIKMTNVVEPSGQQAPANRLIHARQLANASTKEVVTPNVDTNYTQVMMDLSSDALVLRLPHTDRFCLAQILDAWSNCIAAPVATDIEGEYGYYCFTGPNFTGTVPDGMMHIASPTDHVWMLLRTVCMGPNDLPNVHAIQDKMRTYMLSDFLSSGTEYTGKGTYNPQYDFTAPVDYIMTMPMADYFARANELMLTNPPAEADAEWLADLKRINVGPGLTFDASVFGSQAQQMWTDLVRNIIAITTPHSQKFIKPNGSWQFYGEPIAEFGTEFYYRALIAVAALAANPVSVAVYPRANVDSIGQHLNGNHRYRLRISPDNWPDTKAYGFWSITLYGEDNFLYDNSLNRYNITDRDNWQLDKEGNLDIYISHETDTEHPDNWLPAPADDFHLIFRIYNPVDRIAKNEWSMPVIKRLN
jgi:hypothetical protein